MLRPSVYVLPIEESNRAYVLFCLSAAPATPLSLWVCDLIFLETYILHSASLSKGGKFIADLQVQYPSSSVHLNFLFR